MRIDLVVPNHARFGPEAVGSAPEFEAMGYDGLWFTDHVVGYDVFRPVYSSYWLEALTAMTHAAASTDRIRIGAGVLVLPYRDAVYTAKVLATIDVMSNGRVDLGVGTGWCRAEFHGLGRGDRYERRGPCTDEAIEVMRLCWASQGEELAFDGEFSSFRKMRFEPVPVQSPSIPIWVGSRGIAAPPLRRAAKYADVWHPTGLGVDDLEEGSRRLNEIAGREVPISARMRRSGREMDELAEVAAAYRDVGCVQIAVDLESNAAEHLIRDAAQFLESVADLRLPTSA